MTQFSSFDSLFRKEIEAYNDLKQPKLLYKNYSENLRKIQVLKELKTMEQLKKELNSSEFVKLKSMIID